MSMKRAFVRTRLHVCERARARVHCVCVHACVSSCAWPCVCVCACARALAREGAYVCACVRVRACTIGGEVGVEFAHEVREAAAGIQ